MILGPLAEAQMRNAMSIGEGNWTRLRRAADVARLVLLALHRRGAGAAAAACAGWRHRRAGQRLDSLRRSSARRARRDARARADAASRPRQRATVGQPCRWRIASRPARRSTRAGRSGRGCSGSLAARRQERGARLLRDFFSVSRQSAVKPGHITSTRVTPCARQRDQRRLGVGLEPLRLAEAALEGDQPFVLASAPGRSASRRAVLWHSQWYGSPSSSERSGTPWKLSTSLSAAAVRLPVRAHALHQRARCSRLVVVVVARSAAPAGARCGAPRPSRRR